MKEIEPIKAQIIEKISELIKVTIPNGGVDVYGSCATELCLPWSDIDLVLIPPNMNADHHGSSVQYQPKNCLLAVY